MLSLGLPLLGTLLAGATLHGPVADGVLAGLKRLDLVGIFCLILTVALLVDHIALIMSHRHAAKSDARIVELSDKLQAISTARDVQRQVTGETIKVVTRTIHDGNARAEIVEKAPPAPGCKTNTQVMGADL